MGRQTSRRVLLLVVVDHIIVCGALILFAVLDFHALLTKVEPGLIRSCAVLCR
jgi:hypothetical protein